MSIFVVILNVTPYKAGSNLLFLKLFATFKKDQYYRLKHYSSLVLIRLISFSAAPQWPLVPAMVSEVCFIYFKLGF